MFTANGFYSQLHGSYLFYEVGKRAAAFAKAHPEAKIIRMGIGDVTRPLVALAQVRSSFVPHLAQQAGQYQISNRKEGQHLNDC